MTRTKRPRDNQKSRLYNAEDSLIDFVAGCEAKRLPSLRDCQKLVDRIVKSKWWQKRSRIKVIRVTNGRTMALAKLLRLEIAMPVELRNDQYVIHEMAHMLTDDNAESHGPEFASNYLALLRRFKGVRAANELKAIFDNSDVKYRCKKCKDCGKGMKPNKDELRLTRCYDCHVKHRKSYYGATETSRVM